MDLEYFIVTSYFDVLMGQRFVNWKVKYKKKVYDFSIFDYLLSRGIHASAITIQDLPNIISSHIVKTQI